MAVCLGLAACTGGTAVVSARPAASRPARPDAAPPAPDAPSGRDAAAASNRVLAPGNIDALDWILIERPLEGLPRGPAGLRLLAQQVAKQDPAGAYVLDYLDGKQPPRDLEARVARIRAALATSQRSLAFAALLHRDLAEWCLDETAAGARTPEQEELLGAALAEIRERAEIWRAEIFDGKLDPFLGRAERPFQWQMMTKAGPPRDVVRWYDFEGRTWGGQGPAITRAYLARHPLGERMAVPVVRDPGCLDVDTVGVFDVVRASAGLGATCSVQLGRPDASVAADLPRGVLVTWADVVRAADARNHAALVRALSTPGPSIPAPLLLPALRERVAAPSKDRWQDQELRERLDDAWLF